MINKQQGNAKFGLCFAYFIQHKVEMKKRELSETCPIVVDNFK